MAYTPEEQANIDHVLAMFENVLIPFDGSQVLKYIAKDYIQHSPLAPPGAQALTDFLDFVRVESPNAEHKIKRVFADDNHVIVHYHVIRHKGDHGFAVMDIFRLENGMIVEHWDVMRDVVTGGPNPNSEF